MSALESHLAKLNMSLRNFLLVLVIAATAYSQLAQNFDHTEYRRCNRAYVERICTTNFAYVRDLLDTFVDCGQPEAARYAATFCARDEQADLYCGAADAYPLDLGMASFFCASTLQTGGQCSNECRTSLLSIRNDLGCCINTFFNNTALYTPIFGPVLSYTLWSGCGVEPPNSTCEGELSYTLPVTPQRTCSLDEISICRESDIDEIKNSLAGEPGSCEAVLQYNLDRCSRNDDGDCIVNLGDDAGVNIPILQSDCAAALLTRVPDSCSSDCKESLEAFADNRGCCVNALYNSTYTVVTGLNFTISLFQDSVLFDLCDVDTPPLTCAQPDGSLPLKAFTLMMLLPLIAAMLGNKTY